MFKRSLLLGSVLCLASCSYVIDRQIQRVTVLTPGAEDSVCYVYVDGLRHKIHPPESAVISKSRKEMIVDCLAPQNRRRKVVIKPTLSDHAALNVFNGVVPGTAWDLASDSLFTYPDIVNVDFTTAQPMPEALPAHNNPDIRQPEEYDLEEFTSGLPRLNSDRDAVSESIQRRGGAVAEPVKPVYTESAITPQPGPGKPADKGDLKSGSPLTSVMDGLTTSTAKPAPAPATPVSQPAAAAVPYAAPSATPTPAAGVTASTPAQGPAPAPPASPTVGPISPYPIQSKAPSSATPKAETAGPPIPLTAPQ